MPRVVIIAGGANLDSLTDEVQDVANIYSDAGWTVRLCIGKDASRAGMTRAALGAVGAAVCGVGVVGLADHLAATRRVISLGRR